MSTTRKTGALITAFALVLSGAAVGISRWAGKEASPDHSKSQGADDGEGAGNIYAKNNIGTMGGEEIDESAAQIATTEAEEPSTESAITAAPLPEESTAATTPLLEQPESGGGDIETGESGFAELNYPAIFEDDLQAYANDSLKALIAAEATGTEAELAAARETAFLMNLITVPVAYTLPSAADYNKAVTVFAPDGALLVSLKPMYETDERYVYLAAPVASSNGALDYVISPAIGETEGFSTSWTSHDSIATISAWNPGNSPTSTEFEVMAQEPTNVTMSDADGDAYFIQTYLYNEPLGDVAEAFGLSGTEIEPTDLFPRTPQTS